MDDTDEMIHLLSSTVAELKKGIVQYSEMLKTAPPESQAQFQEYIKEMHQIALRLNNGVEGLQRLRVLKQNLTNQQG